MIIDCLRVFLSENNPKNFYVHKLKNQFAVRLDNMLVPPAIEDNSLSNFEKEIYMDALYSMTKAEMTQLPECLEKSILIDKESYRKINLFADNIGSTYAGLGPDYRILG